MSEIEKQPAHAHCVVLDVSDVQHIDTTFLRFLVSLKHHADNVDRSDVKIVGASTHLRRVLASAGMSELFVIEPA